MDSLAKKYNTSEAMIIFLLGAVQFIDIIDFMMVMPLGPELAIAFDADPSKLGYTAVVYTIAAAISGMFVATFLDRYKRKNVLLFLLCGLVFAAILGGLAQSFNQLLAARFIAGAFGGPTTAMSFALIIDIFPEERRGYAMGRVVGAFSIAAIVGVPFGLELTRLLSWRLPFFTEVIMAIAVIILIKLKLPHVKLDKNTKPKVSYKGLFDSREKIIAYYITTMGMFAAFFVIPYISAHIQFNLKYPREYITYLYLTGGIASFFAMRVAGRMIDKYGATVVFSSGILFISITLIGGFIKYESFSHFPLLLIFSPFLVGISIRNVANFSLASRVPSDNERAGFMAVLSSFQNLATALGSFFAASILIRTEQGGILHIEYIAVISLFLSLSIFPFMYYLEKRIANK